MKKLLLFLSLFPIYCFSQIEITALSAYEINPGIINISWICDTTVTKYCYFYIGEYKQQESNYGYTHTFVVLLKQPTIMYTDFQCSSISIIQNGNVIKLELYEKYVNEDFTLKEGLYTFGMGTGDGFYQSGQMRSVILSVVGNNIVSIDNIIIHNITKYIDSNSYQLLIKKNNHIYNIYGLELELHEMKHAYSYCLP